MIRRSTASLLRFTGERLHSESRLFAADLARHESAYRHARSLIRGGPQRGRILDLGAGSGHGTRCLAAALHPIVGLDNVLPDPPAANGTESPAAAFVVGDLLALPLRAQSFTWLVSFQVIEHLADPHPYLAAAARLLEPQGTAFVSTPNRLTSDGTNPHHAREYSRPELAGILARHFRRVELLGVGTSARARRYQDARLRQMRRLLGLDPLRLRRRLPPALLERAYGALAIVVRLLVRRRLDLGTIDWRDYPIGAYTDDCLDLFAVCRP